MKERGGKRRKVWVCILVVFGHFGSLVSQEPDSAA